MPASFEAAIPNPSSASLKDRPEVAIRQRQDIQMKKRTTRVIEDNVLEVVLVGFRVASPLKGGLGFRARRGVHGVPLVSEIAEMLAIYKSS
jgi:hypothetical protein